MNRIVGKVCVLVMGGMLLSACWPRNLNGHEAGVVETCSGVDGKILDPGTHFLSLICSDLFTYNVGKQLFTMNDAQGEGLHDEDRLEVKTKSGQTVWLNIRVEYQLEKAKLVGLHTSVRDQYEQILIRPEVIRTTKDRATTMEALDIFAGQTRVDLQNTVEKALLDDEDLRGAGIVVHTFIIERVDLDPDYKKEIDQKAVAQQRKLKEQEMAGAAQESAKRVAAEAQAAVEQTRATAEGAKIKAVLEAESKKEAAILEAEGIIARGRAEAEVDKLKRDALYAGEGGAWRAKVEIARANAEQLKGMLQGANVISDRAVLQLVDGHGKAAPVTPTVSP